MPGEKKAQEDVYGSGPVQRTQYEAKSAIAQTHIQQCDSCMLRTASTWQAFGFFLILVLLLFVFLPSGDKMHPTARSRIQRVRSYILAQ